jgi:hypothetical protein
LHNLPLDSPEFNLIERHLGRVNATEVARRANPAMPSLLSVIDQALR